MFFIWRMSPAEEALMTAPNGKRNFLPPVSLTRQGHATVTPPQSLGPQPHRQPAWLYVS